MSELLYSGYNNIVFSLNRNNVNIQNFKINLFKKIATSHICSEMTQICLCTRVPFTAPHHCLPSLKRVSAFQSGWKKDGQGSTSWHPAWPSSLQSWREIKGKGYGTGDSPPECNALDFQSAKLTAYRRPSENVQFNTHQSSAKSTWCMMGSRTSLTQKETCSSSGKWF